MKYSYEQIEGSMGFPRDFIRERRGIEWQAKNLLQRGGIPRNDPYLPDIG